MLTPRMLILCTGNSARSQMAEGLMRHYAGNEFQVFSAGLDPKGVNPLAIQAMHEIGIDISHHTSKDVRTFLGQSFSYLITVCSNAEDRCPIFPGVFFRLFWPFDDPAAETGSEEHKLQKFREVRDLIDIKIKMWLAEREQQRQAAR